MADLNQQVPVVQPPLPLEWNWIVQRHEVNGKGTSVWKFGFFAPDGAEVRVTFHQVGDVEGQQQEKQQEQQAQAAQAMQMGMPPSSDPTAFAPPGVPQTDQTENATFYVTFFTNRNPEYFMKWDTSLLHEDSLTVWITVTHGVIDFVRKAHPANIILDDLANGKLKMVLRSVAMDIVAANPEYQIEQTQRHHYRTLYQIKKAGMQSAFDHTVQGGPAEGDTQAPQQASPVTGGQAQVAAQTDQQGGEQQQGDVATGTDDKTEDPTQPQPKKDESEPAFASAEPSPIKMTPSLKKGFTIEIGKDYSIAVKDKGGNAVDRYRAKGPADILRWLNEKGYGANRMKIVDKEQPSGDKELAPETPEKQPKAAAMFPSGQDTRQYEHFEVKGTSVLMHTKLEAKQAAMMNEIVNALEVRLAEDGVEFGFDSEKDMSFKKALVELAAKRVGIQF